MRNLYRIIITHNRTDNDISDIYPNDILKTEELQSFERLPPARKISDGYYKYTLRDINLYLNGKYPLFDSTDVEILEKRGHSLVYNRRYEKIYIVDIDHPHQLDFKKQIQREEKLEKILKL